jgi:hypothetical protein
MITTVGHRLRGDEEVIAADRPASLFEPGAATMLCGTITQPRGYDYAGADLRFSKLTKTPR